MTKYSYCEQQPIYLVFEQIHAKAGMPLPSTAKGAVAPGLYQVFRRILQVCNEKGVYFDGKRISSANEWHYIQEFLRPGKQITTRTTGEQNFELVYAGFKNYLTPLPKIGNLFPDAWTKAYDLGSPPSIFSLGNDPIPSIKLYGNPLANFVMIGGAPPPAAIGLYNKKNDKLTFPDFSKRDSIIKKLLQPKPARRLN